ncbi:hypothetical protein ABE504_27965 [Paenibacillus oryzisoli]|uniref:hypothetical protein n=1 Tax=Paenibacillus oryzisoli TaxID=1850517 RepID=UPI003D2C4D6C
MSNLNFLPKLAGVCKITEAAVQGVSVDENVDRLKRMHYLKKSIYELMASFMNRTPEWEVKGALALHIWLDSEHVASLRKRVSEMREPPLHLDKIPDERLQRLTDEAMRAATTIELLSGLKLLRTALAQAYQAYVRATNPLNDHPSCRMLKLIKLEEEEMLTWLGDALEVLLDTAEKREEAERWEDHLSAYLAAAQGVLGELPAFAGTLPAARSDQPFKLELVPQRDERFKDLYNSVLTADEVYQDRSRDPKERVWALFYKRLREMDVPEMQCSIVAQTKGKPWEYYADMGRQIWDEARHSMMGEVGFLMNGIDFAQLPIRVNFSYELNTMLTPEERHAILYAIEFGLMPGDTGKKYEWETAIASGYDLAVSIQDYDWADEVLHAQIGRKWIIPVFGGNKETLEMADKAWEKMAALRGAYVSENPDWWEQFYETVKQKPFVSVTES